MVAILFPNASNSMISQDCLDGFVSLVLPDPGFSVGLPLVSSFRLTFFNLYFDINFSLFMASLWIMNTNPTIVNPFVSPLKQSTIPDKKDGRKCFLLGWWNNTFFRVRYSQGIDRNSQTPPLYLYQSYYSGLHIVWRCSFAPLKVKVNKDPQTGETNQSNECYTAINEVFYQNSIVVYVVIRHKKVPSLEVCQTNSVSLTTRF